ncbi:hypothetical protein PoB_000370900 [Plakobranchus ocellatus]|uniref:Uncharacterized protein n=1 Tax=Plakobranchus ocellatus TaxID=259542 RepID=A0AAV3Y2K0_9GAST|nr:hypothetical protein PoB_000370900 [Plakobranchus ocellatus]
MQLRQLNSQRLSWENDRGFTTENTKTKPERKKTGANVGKKDKQGSGVSTGDYLSMSVASPPAPWPDGSPENLSSSCGLAIHTHTKPNLFPLSLTLRVHATVQRYLHPTLYRTSSFYPSPLSSFLPLTLRLDVYVHRYLPPTFYRTFILPLSDVFLPTVNTTS